MTDPRHYVLIDEHSGYVWGEAVAADPVAACRAVDERLGETERVYEDIGGGARFAGRSGYHVYEAPAGFPSVLDGQNPDEVSRVMALPCVTQVVTRDLDRDGVPSRI
jgi:hypothetical protein